MRDRNAVVVMSVEELERLAPAEPRPSLLSFLESAMGSISFANLNGAATSSHERMATRH